MKKLLLTLLVLSLTFNVYAAPSTTISVPNPAVANTVIQSSSYNSNNNEIQSKYNAHTHTDITQVGTITTGTWAATPPTTQYGGTGLDLSTATQGTLLYFSGTGTLAKRTASASGLALVTKGDSNNPVWESPSITTAGLPVGSIIQVVNYQRTDQVTCATAIANDNDARTSSEGNQVLTVNITPTSNSNKLRIDVVVMSGSAATANRACIILMDGTTVLATGRDSSYYGDYSNQIILTYFMSSPGTSAKTFNVNLGAAASTAYLNSNGSAAVDDGKLTSSITITEIKG